MRANRRTFMKIGGAAAAASAAAACKLLRPNTSNGLEVQIQGLCLIERKAGKVSVFFLDVDKIQGTMPSMSIKQHTPYLSVLATDVVSATAALTNDPYKSGRKVAQLRNHNSAVDAGIAGGPNLSFNDDAIGESVPSADPAHWQSVKFAARMKEICGASKISDYSKFQGSIELEHGHLASRVPKSDIGRAVRWKFTPASGSSRPALTQVMTDTLACTMSTTSQTATFNIDSENVVVKLPATVIVMNLPPSGTAGICSGSKPCVDHMALYYEIVDKTDVPTAAALDPMPSSSSADPDYCPPGSV